MVRGDTGMVRGDTNQGKSSGWFRDTRMVREDTNQGERITLIRGGSWSYEDGSWRHEPGKGSGWFVETRTKER